VIARKLDAETVDAAIVAVLRPGQGVTRENDVAHPMHGVVKVNDVTRASVVARRRAAVAVDRDQTARVVVRRCSDLASDRWPVREAVVLPAVLQNATVMWARMIRAMTDRAMESDASIVAHPTRGAANTVARRWSGAVP
jgi:hypothetical protein